MRKLDVCDLEKFGAVDSSEKTIAILGDRCWPQRTKLEGGEKKQAIVLNIRKKHTECPTVGGVSM